MPVQIIYIKMIQNWYIEVHPNVREGMYKQNILH